MLSTEDNNTKNHCQAHYMCRANLALSKFGQTGKIIGHLLSNVMAGAFFRGEKANVTLALSEAAKGRQGEYCRIDDKCI